MSYRKLGLLLGLALVAFVVLGAAVATAGDDPQPIDFTHNGVDAPAPIATAVWGSGPTVKIGTPFCSTTTSAAANVNTDCETKSAGPHNETSIAVNPTNSLNIIGGANDYQIGLNPGGHISETLLSRAHVSFDGGQTWTEYPLNANSAYQATGDPAVAFDAAGNAYYATLGFRFVGPVSAQNPDVLVSSSSDGGKNWSMSRIAQGSGTETSVGDLLDKEYVAAWGNGNAIVTFGDFRLGHKGAFVNSRIYASVTHDAGKSWSTPQVISGSLDEAFVSTPTVAGSRIFVSFLNTDDLVTGRDDYKVVEVNPATGAAVGAPVDVGLVYDGNGDFPFAFGRPTYQDSVFRSWSAGNITADPNNPNHLAVVWSDWRDGTLPANPDPYAGTTNADIIVSESTNAGQTWSAPTAYQIPGDQFMPWGAFDASGTLRVGTFDRSYDSANHKYGYTLLNGTPASYTSTQVSTELSDPTTGDLWFARTLNPNFPAATAFLGDYSGIAVVPETTSVVAYWTDMRNQASFGGRTGSNEDAYFARIP